jgi:hypothetical protein
VGQPPDHPMYEKWRISYLRSVVQHLLKLLEINGYITSLIGMMRLKHDSLGAIITSVLNAKI